MLSEFVFFKKCVGGGKSPNYYSELTEKHYLVMYDSLGCIILMRKDWIEDIPPWKTSFLT